MVLDRDASADSRGIWSNLDDNLAIVGQAHTDHKRKMSAAEKDLDRPRAEQLLAPSVQTLPVDRGCVQRSLLRSALAWLDAAEEVRLRKHRGRTRDDELKVLVGELLEDVVRHGELRPVL